MTVERWIRVIAGLFVFLSVALGAPASPLFVSEWFLAFTAFVGLNLFQFGFTNLPAGHHPEEAGRARARHPLQGLLRREAEAAMNGAHPTR